MKVKDLSGRIHHLDTRQNSHPLRSKAACKSNLQYECGQFLKEKFPLEPILEEVPVPGENLTLDFFLALSRICIEVNGNQHDKYVPFFHKSVEQFKQSIERDKRKAEWCAINEIDLFVVKNIDELKEIL